ncbi:hypothetical protein [Candidatus Methylacidithermus pantelleriae]|uniref:Uncharacterized protein n=1 Tax=Candidatus Methylacidithermus pantelleriae TaxID=2744239 RepID=A0A8J2BLD4_9BACT|nr:hypothetical protein [Candidatus Methylacidithermus pantelleriae]CAF0704918.1 hypothetical protein MPNT_80019 [Candidatus Methylacidithermus pantelleriae]
MRVQVYPRRFQGVQWLAVTLIMGCVMLPWKRAYAGRPVSVDAFIGQAGQWATTVQQDLDCIRGDVNQIEQHTQATMGHTGRLEDMAQGTKNSYAKMAKISELSNLAGMLRSVPLFGSNGMNDPLLWATLFLLRNGGLTGNALGVPPNAFTPGASPIPGGSPGIVGGSSPGSMGMINPNMVAGNILGYSGMPIGLEGFPPQILTPLNSDQFAAAQQLAQNFSQSPQYPAVYNAAMSELGQLAGGGQQNVPLQGVQMVADGAFIRPVVPEVDPTYMAVIWSRTGTEVVLFWANQGTGANYSPIGGMNPFLAPNLGSILAGQQTLYQIGKSGGKGPLPMWLAPSRDVILTALQKAVPGQALNVPLQQWQPMSWWRAPLLRQLVTFGRLQRVQAIQNDAWQNAAGTLVTGLTTPHWASFRTQLQANTERIAEVRLQEIATTQMLRYLVGDNGQQGLLGALESLSKAANALRQSMEGDAAIGEITLLVQDVAAAHAQQQQFAQNLSHELEQYRDTLRQLLRERKEIYDSMVQQAALDGQSLAHAILDQIRAIHDSNTQGSATDGENGKNL